MKAMVRNELEYIGGAIWTCCAVLFKILLWGAIISLAVGVFITLPSAPWWASAIIILLVLLVLK
jgi:hypothetical protein